MTTMRQIEVLCAVIDAGSVTQASKRLHLSQPAVSKLLSTLERETGLTLFERRNRRLIPTPEAERLYEEAQRVFVGLTGIGRLAEELRSLNSGALVIATLAALGRERLPSLLAQFLSQRPKISLSYQVRSSNKVLQWAIAQQLDIGLAMTNADHPAVRSELLASTDAVCVLPKDHPLTNRDVVCPEDLAAVPFISFGREGRMRHTIDQVFEERGVQRNLVVETFNSDSVCLLAAQGMGVAIVDSFSATNFGRDVAIRPFRPAIPYEFRLLFPGFRPQSRLAETFTAFLKERIGAEATRLQARFAPRRLHS